MKSFLFSVKPLTLSVVLSLVFLSGCATTKQEPEQWLKDKALVVQSLQDAHVANAKLQTNINSMDNRVLTLERMVSKQATQIQSMQATMKDIKEKARAKKARVPHKKKRKRNKKAKRIKKKLDVISEKLVIPVAKSTEKPISSTDEKNSYTAAYLALKSGRYDESSAGFIAVVRTYPGGEYTDQAYYWLGESLVAQGRQQEAVDAFSTVANKFPRSAKHAVALLKLATTYQNLRRTGDARAALARIIQEHPDSRTAERARSQLQSLSGAQ